MNLIRQGKHNYTGVVNGVISENPFEKLPMFALMSYFFFHHNSNSTAASLRENVSIRFLLVFLCILVSEQIHTIVFIFISKKFQITMLSH